ncbi:putative Kinase [Melia azedarach]|uniref:Kinase n=1 Tax=Melia azedarach TaxID=155640 RepID=A0ACC1YMN3_MELAZ|nr:putative Kinase [Melia azedarach]
MITKTDCVLWLMLILLWPTTKAAAAATGLNAKPNCPEKCGEVTIPYPFGIGENCALNNHFILQCNHNSELLLGTSNISVLEISVESGTISGSILTAKRCYSGSGAIISDSVSSTNLGEGPFTFSDTRNKLMGSGCDTLALMTDPTQGFISGCASFCAAETPSVNTTKDFCSGLGCCQIPFPRSVKTLNLSLSTFYYHNRTLNIRPCDYAFLVDGTSDVRLLSGSVEEEFRFSNGTIEWVVKEQRCETSIHLADYACRDNTDCIYSENGQGYRCLCKQGFHGNPYLGCYDIDECKEPTKYKCDGTCKDTIGNYTCHCPLGKHGDGKVGCEGLGITKIFAIIGAIIVAVIFGVLILILRKERRKQRNFLKNGGIILQHQRVRIFKAAELEKATKNYDDSHLLGEGGFGSVYKGVLPDNTQVAVKKPRETDKIQINKEFQQELGIISQVNHKNVVKILGLCLETKVPLLVYEFVSNGTLYHHIRDKNSQILST